ncbi:MAG: helix-turn-helix domain-containing protein [Pseudonocardiaceae bacterium]
MIVFPLRVDVAEWLACRGRIDTPRPQSCPVCGHGRLTFDGWWPRRTRRGRVDIHRVRCANDACQQRSHSLVPDVLVSGRVDMADVIGGALEAKADGWGHRRIAARLEICASTVRRWLRRAARHGMGIAGRLSAAAAAADPGVRAPPAGDPVGVMAAAARIAAQAYGR